MQSSSDQTTPDQTIPVQAPPAQAQPEQTRIDKQLIDLTKEIRLIERSVGDLKLNEKVLFDQVSFRTTQLIKVTASIAVFNALLQADRYHIRNKLKQLKEQAALDSIRALQDANDKLSSLTTRLTEINRINSKLMYFTTSTNVEDSSKPKFMYLTHAKKVKPTEDVEEDDIDTSNMAAHIDGEYISFLVIEIDSMYHNVIDIKRNEHFLRDEIESQTEDLKSMTAKIALFNYMLRDQQHGIHCELNQLRQLAAHDAIKVLQDVNDKFTELALKLKEIQRISRQFHYFTCVRKNEWQP